MRSGLIWLARRSGSRSPRALIQVQQRGIRTARVVQASAPALFHMLRIERADAALASQLTSAKADALGKGFYDCARPETSQR